MKIEINQDNPMNLKSIEFMRYIEHKKPTKRIPILMQIEHSVTKQIITKEVLTKDVETYLKNYNGLNSNGSNWTMVPLKRYRVWLEDSVEPEGGFWWHCFKDARGYLRQEGYHYKNPKELDTLQQYIIWGYKVKEL
jgi:hypothetical protein